MKDTTTIQLKRKTWQELMTIKVRTSAPDLDTVIQEILSKAQKRNK